MSPRADPQATGSALDRSGDHASLGVVAIAPGQLYLLPNAFELDGRVSSHPLDARGFAPLNCYLVRERDHALLLDTGFSAHEQTLCAQLDALVSPTERLSVWSLRIGEYASICNVRPVVERYNVDVLYGSQGTPPEWVDFRPELVPYGSAVAVGALGQIEHRLARQGDSIAVGSHGRALLTLVAPLRLLPTNWIYDEHTRTLFTSDAFHYAWRPTPAGPWLITDEDDPTTPEAVMDFLLGSRFWWLAGASTEPIRRAIAEIFDTYPVETIAPSYGCVLHGRRTVERHYRMLDQVLADAAALPSIGLEINGWRTAAAR